MENKLKWKWVKFWGKKRRIVYTDKLKKDEVLFYGYTIYLSNK